MKLEPLLIKCKFLHKLIQFIIVSEKKKKSCFKGAILMAQDACRLGFRDGQIRDVNGSG